MDGRRKTIRLKCAYCQQPFWGRSQPWKEGKPRFCSTKHSSCFYYRQTHPLRPQTIPCLTCQKSFKPTSANSKYCKRKCRPSFWRVSSQAGTFLVAGMTPAEFAFKTIMQERGITLQYFNPHSQAFELNRRAFQLNGRHYTPDFEDPATGILYEVIGTRQAYHQGRKKVAAFRSAYPDRTLLVVRPDGTGYRTVPRKKSREGGTP